MAADKTAEKKPRKPSTTTTAEQWQVYLLAIKDGFSVTRAAAQAGISRATVQRARAGRMSTPEYRRAKAIFDQMHPKEPVAEDGLCPEARRALTDFGYFRRRYLGRVSVPWVDHSAQLVAEMLASPHKEYAVVNQPPGVGKTTFWTVDLPLWLICRNRGVRILIGSAAQSTAALNVQQIRRELERQEPSEASEEWKKKGLAVDAEATIANDFGNFKPPRGEAWTAERFVVVQASDAAKVNKEDTVSAFGMDSRFLGRRVDLAVWDDVVDEKAVNTPEKREAVQKWWEQYAETRLEPGGLLVLQGQRLHAEDLYHHCINVEVGDYGTDDDPFAEPVGFRKQYRHVKFRAHYDDPEICKGEHSPKTARPYDPDNPTGSGCLLDPRRLMFRNLMEVKDKDNRLYTVTYQQEDTDPASVLVPLEWINGGRNPETQEEFPGCWDRERSMGVIPRNLTKPWLSVITADPSPAKFWSVQWWLYHPQSEMRLLIDHYRGKMTASELIDYEIATQTYVGLLERWHQTATEEGAPFSHVIIERAAAQRWIYMSEAAKTWAQTRHVTFVGHDTHGQNKADPKFGVESLVPRVYRYGNVSLPSGDQLSRGRSMALVGEVTRYPEASTTDCVMAQWFLEYNIPRLRQEVLRPAAPPQRTVPSWLKRNR